MSSRKLAPSLCTVVYFLIVFPCYVDADNGFFFPTDANIDLRVRLATDRGAIFQIVPLARNPTSSIDFSDYSAHSPQLDDGILEHVTVDSVRWCANLQLASCALYVKGAGTAFLAGDSVSLWTAAHIVRSEGEGETYEEDVSRNVEFILFDPLRNVVFDTRRPADKARMFLPKRKSLPRTKHLSLLADDFVRIELSHPIGVKPLELSMRAACPGEPVFNVGYPSQTSTRELFFHQPDAKPIGIHVSAGVNVAMGRWIMGNLSDGDLATLSDSSLVTSGDSSPGISGSPILDGEGKVIGLAHHLLVREWGNGTLGTRTSQLLKVASWRTPQSEHDVESPSVCPRACRKTADVPCRLSFVRALLTEHFTGTPPGLDDWKMWSPTVFQYVTRIKNELPILGSLDVNRHWFRTHEQALVNTLQEADSALQGRQRDEFIEISRRLMRIYVQKHQRYSGDKEYFLRSLVTLERILALAAPSLTVIACAEPAHDCEKFHPPVPRPNRSIRAPASLPSQ